MKDDLIYRARAIFTVFTPEDIEAGMKDTAVKRWLEDFELWEADQKRINFGVEEELDRMTRIK